MSTKSLLTIVILLFSLIAVIYLVLRPAVLTGRASGTSGNTITLENSYLFASPLTAKADGKQIVRITVFLLDGRGLGVSSQTVKLSAPQTVTILDTQSVTDDTGKAVFDLTSPTSGRFEISATANGQSLPQKVSVVFY